MAEPTIDIKQDVDGNNNIIIGQGANVVINQGADGQHEVRRSIPELLAHRTDRDAQKRTLRRALAAHLKERPSRPFVMLIVGEEAENPKSFLDVLQEYTVPELTANHGPIRHSLLTWPDPHNSTAHRLDALGEVLQERLEHPPLERVDISTDDAHSCICNVLTRAGQPLFFESHLTDRDWQADDVALIQSWLSFWDALPNLDPLNPVVVALCVEFLPDLRKFRLFGNPKKQQEDIRQIIQAIDFATFPSLGGTLLPELGAIARKHVEAWIEHLACDFADKAALNRKVRALYNEHNDQPLSMEVLAPKLEAFIQELQP